MLRKDNKNLKKKFDCMLNEKNSLQEKFKNVLKENVSKKNKKNDSHSHHTLHATINQNEIKTLKNKINCLSSTLSKCAFNHKKLETLFSRKQVPHVHAHHPHHAYAHLARHDHTHTHMHPKVYKCTHCGRKCHLAKFLRKMFGFH